MTVNPPVLERLHSRILSAVGRSTPGWLISDVDDIAQAAWIKLARQGRSEHSLEGIKPGYLWRLAHSEVIDEIRRRRRRAEVALEEAANLVDDRLPDVEQRVASRRLGAAIQDSLVELVPSRRRAVCLFLVGNKVPEVANLLGLSKKQAENLVFRGLKDLRGRLRERGFGRRSA